MMKSVPGYKNHGMPRGKMTHQWLLPSECLMPRALYSGMEYSC